MSERAGGEKSVDVHDPQKLRRRRLQFRRERWDGQVQHREVHRVEDAGQQLLDVVDYGRSFTVGVRAKL